LDFLKKPFGLIFIFFISVFFGSFVGNPKKASWKAENMEKERRYIDPTTDYGFKRIFGEDADNKELLMFLINGLFRGRKIVKSIAYAPNDHVGDTEDIGTVIFDLACTDQDGNTFVVEVQRTSQMNLKKRMLAYAGRLISDQIPKGERSLWNYDLKGTYVIVIMDGFQMPGGSNGNVIHDICLCDRDTKEIFYEDFGLIFVELDNFTKTEEEVAKSSKLDKLLHVLKNMPKMDERPPYLQEPIFERLFNVAEYATMNKEEQDMYNASLKQKWDEQSRWETAMSMGMKQGRQEEREKAEAEKISIALNFKKMGIPIENISLGTGLSIDQIKRL